MRVSRRTYSHKPSTGESAQLKKSISNLEGEVAGKEALLKELSLKNRQMEETSRETTWKDNSLLNKIAEMARDSNMINRMIEKKNSSIQALNGEIERLRCVVSNVRRVV